MLDPGYYKTYAEQEGTVRAYYAAALEGRREMRRSTDVDLLQLLVARLAGPATTAAADTLIGFVVCYLEESGYDDTHFHPVRPGDSTRIAPPAGLRRCCVVVSLIWLVRWQVGVIEEIYVQPADSWVRAIQPSRPLSTQQLTACYTHVKAADQPSTSVRRCSDSERMADGGRRQRRRASHCVGSGALCCWRPRG